MDSDGRPVKRPGFVLPDVGYERVVGRVRPDLSPVAVICRNELVVQLVKVDAVRILEAGVGAADGPDRRIGAMRVALEQRNGVRLLHRNGDLVAFRGQRHVPRLVRQNQRSPRLHVAVIVVRKRDHAVAAVVVDGVELLPSRIDLDTGNEPELRLWTEHPLLRFGGFVRGTSRHAVVDQQRVPILVAEDHPVVFGVERDAIEGGKRIGDRSNRRNDTANRLRRPFVGGDAPFLREACRRLADRKRGRVGAVGREQRFKRRLVKTGAGRENVLRRGRAAGQQQSQPG